MRKIISAIIVLHALVSVYGNPIAIIFGVEEVIMSSEEVRVRYEGGVVCVEGTFEMIYKRDHISRDDDEYEVLFPAYVPNGESVEVHMSDGHRKVRAELIEDHSDMALPDVEGGSFKWYSARFGPSEDVVRVRISYEQGLAGGHFYYFPIIKNKSMYRKGASHRMVVDNRNAESVHLPKFDNMELARGSVSFDLQDGDLIAVVTAAGSLTSTPAALRAP